MRHGRQENSWCSMLGQEYGKMTDQFEYCVIQTNKNTTFLKENLSSLFHIQGIK